MQRPAPTFSLRKTVANVIRHSSSDKGCLYNVLAITHYEYPLISSIRTHHAFDAVGK